jgi:hypothetical protein
VKAVLAILGVALVGTVVWAVVVFSRPAPRFGPGNDGPEPTPLSGEQVRILAMARLQEGVAAEMRHFIDNGRFTDDPGVAGAGVAPQVCEGEKVVALLATAADGSVFAVKARGLDPPSAGEAVFSHYTAEKGCDASDGPETWPGGYHVTRQGLKKGDEVVDVPLS